MQIHVAFAHSLNTTVKMDQAWTFTELQQDSLHNYGFDWCDVRLFWHLT